MKQIDISTKKYPNTFAIVDDEDFEYVKKTCKWCYGGRYVQGCKKIKNKYKLLLLHRHVLERKYGKYKGLVTDHINHNTLDNRKCNLRICTDTENKKNQSKHKDGKSIYKGVQIILQDKKYKYIRSKIQHNGIEYHLGSFKTEIEAARAYDKKALELHGEFAKINGV